MEGTESIIVTSRMVIKIVTPEILSRIMATGDEHIIKTELGIKNQDGMDREKRRLVEGATMLENTFRRFVLTDKTTGAHIGNCSFHNWKQIHRRTDLGYEIAYDEFKNRGLMTEALRALIPHAFNEMNINRIEAFTSTLNVPSRKMLTNLGFTEEGILLQDFFKGGNFEDSVCYRLLRSEYFSAER